MDWKSGLSDADRRLLEQKAAPNLKSAVVSALTLGLFSAVKYGMSSSDAQALDKTRSMITVQQLHRSQIQRPNWYDQLELKIKDMVGDAVLELDDFSGGHAQQGALWVERKLTQLSREIQGWWRDEVA